MPAVRTVVNHVAGPLVIKTTVTAMAAKGQRGEAEGRRMRQQSSPFSDIAVGSE